MKHARWVLEHRACCTGERILMDTHKSVLDGYSQECSFSFSSVIITISGATRVELPVVPPFPARPSYYCPTMLPTKVIFQRNCPFSNFAEETRRKRSKSVFIGNEISTLKLLQWTWALWEQNLQSKYPRDTGVNQKESNKKCPTKTKLPLQALFLLFRCPKWFQNHRSNFIGLSAKALHFLHTTHLFAQKVYRIFDRGAIPDICHLYHMWFLWRTNLPCGETSDFYTWHIKVEKFQIYPHARCEKIWILSTCEEISNFSTWQMWRNLKFILFCCKISFVAKSVLSQNLCCRNLCVEKNWAKHCVCGGNDKYQVCVKPCTF